MSLLALCALPLLGLSSPIPDPLSYSLQPRDVIPIDGTSAAASTVPYVTKPPPEFAGNNRECVNSKAFNLWSSISDLQAPGAVRNPGLAPIPIQSYIPPALLTCDLIAYFSFSAMGANKIGNTQTLALPAGKVYLLSFALAMDSNRIKKIKTWTTTPPPATDGYKELQELKPDLQKGEGQNGVMQFQIGQPGEGQLMNTHFEIEFENSGAQGTIGLFSTPIPPQPVKRHRPWWKTVLNVFMPVTNVIPAFTPVGDDPIN